MLLEAQSGRKSLEPNPSPASPFPQEIQHFQYRILGEYGKLTDRSPHYRYHSGRYGLPDILQEDGSVVIEL